jgi:PAS domain S-box-containing protein
VRPTDLSARAVLRYALAPVAIAAALGLARAFLYFHWGQPFAVFAYCAIAVTFWYGGIGPGILASLLAAIVRTYLPDPGVTGSARVIYDVAFLLYAALMIQATRAGRELERRVAERTADLRQANENLKLEIAERVRAEEKLTESEAHLAEAQRLAHVGSWVWRVEGRQVVSLSEEWYRIYGFNPEEGVPNWEQRLERIYPEDRARYQAAIDRAIRDNADYDVEFRIVVPSGAIKYVHTVGHPVRNASGDLAEFIGVTMDITERKRAEEERGRLRNLEADLAHINRVSLMGELAASLAHEIKQPIAAASTNARTGMRWLQREPPEIEEGRQAVLRIVQDMKRAADIIDRNRALYARGTPKYELMDMKEIIREIVDLLRDVARRESITVRTELGEGVATISADRVQVQQVLMNLMLNGIEAMKDRSGELTVTSNKTGDGQLLVAVSDSGVGLPIEEGERIFEAFFTTKSQGTGMGLSISRRIIESHGGRLWATANTGRGATFQFTLPLDQVKASSTSGS